MNKDSIFIMALVGLLFIFHQQGHAQLTTLPSGGNKKALTYLQKAQLKAPDKLNRDNVEKMIKKTLQEEKDIN